MADVKRLPPTVNTPPKAPTAPGAALTSEAELRTWFWMSQDTFSTLLETGVSRPKNEDAISRCTKAFAKARTSYRAGQFDEAAQWLTQADLAMHEAVAQRGAWFRFRLHAPFLFVYLVSCLLAILWYALGKEIADDKLFWGVPLAAVGFGALGSILRSLYWLHQQLGRRVHRVFFTIGHLGAPFIGALFGTFVYLLLKAGLIVFSGQTEGAEPKGFATFALCFLCGFNWKPLLAWVENFKIGSAASAAAPADPAAPKDGDGDDPDAEGDPDPDDPEDPEDDETADGEIESGVTEDRNDGAGGDAEPAERLDPDNPDPTGQPR